jgi:hypothetical protein
MLDAVPRPLLQLLHTTLAASQYEDVRVEILRDESGEIWALDVIFDGEEGGEL